MKSGYCSSVQYRSVYKVLKKNPYQKIKKRKIDAKRCKRMQKDAKGCKRMQKDAKGFKKILDTRQQKEIEYQV